MKIGSVLKDYRYANRVGIRDVAQEIGVSVSVLSRIENGANFDCHAMGKIMLWLFSEMKPKAKRQKDSG